MMVVENLSEREREMLRSKNRNKRREERVCRSIIFKLLTNRTLTLAEML